MKKAVFILILGLTFNNSAYSQLSDEEASNALAKYWLYKWRFLNDFIKVGDQPGESLPVAERAALGLPIFRFGDATQKLGMYLCLLATEYRLLYDNERWADIESTKTELYYAIEAYRRLDCTGELQRPYYKDDEIDWCNGYFMRDDIDLDFLTKPAKPWDPSNTQTNADLLNQQFTDFCYDIDPSNPVIYNGEVDELRVFVDPSGDQNCSDFAVQKYRIGNNGDLVNEESQDQVFCLLQGLGLITKLIPDGLHNVKLNDGTIISYDFVYESKQLVDEMIWYVKKLSINTSTGTFIAPYNDWIILNPDNDFVHRGAAGFQYSYPMSIIGNNIMGFPYNYQDGITALFRNFWNIQQLNLNQSGNAGDLNTSMQCQLAAMSDSWFTSVVNVTPTRLYEKAQDHDWEALYLPLWSVWNNKPIPNSIEEDVFESIYDDILSAPCYGPYRFRSGNIVYLAAQWSTVFKYFKEISMTQHGLGSYISGFYNGNDYMLMHNLHYLVSEIPLPMFHNLIDRYIDYPVPGIAPGNPLGIVVPQPLNVNAFHTITADNIVQDDWQVNFRAGYEITLKPGFHAEAGTDFHAYVEPFTCVNGEYRNENADSTLATAYGFNERFQFKNHGIIDYSEEEETQDKLTEETLPELDISKIILLFPNPTNDKFTYLLPEKTDDEIHQTIEVYSLTGDLVHQENVNYSGQNAIDIGEVAAGIYIVKVISGEIVYSAKLIVE